MPHDLGPSTNRRQAWCPRCGFETNARLHMIVATDAFSCPRCEGLDGLTIPMFIDAREGRGVAPPPPGSARRVGRHGSG